jgi:hypothetical protein
MKRLLVRLLFKEESRIIICEALLTEAEKSYSHKFKRNAVNLVRIFRNKPRIKS